MTKKKTDNSNFLMVLGFVAVVGILWYGGEQGWFKTTASIIEGKISPINLNLNIVPNPLDYVEPNSGYEVALDVVPNRICVGEEVTGSITSNIKNGFCRVWINSNDTGWVKLADVALNSLGSYQYTQRVYGLGYANFGAICCDSKYLCKLSNIVRLEVIDCSTPTPTPAPTPTPTPTEEDTSGYTCGVASYCLAGTCPTGYSCVEVSNLSVVWCACVNGNNEVHPNWKPDGPNFYPR